MRVDWCVSSWFRIKNSLSLASPPPPPLPGAWSPVHARARRADGLPGESEWRVLLFCYMNMKASLPACSLASARALGRQSACPRTAAGRLFSRLKRAHVLLSLTPGADPRISLLPPRDTWPSEAPAHWLETSPVLARFIRPPRRPRRLPRRARLRPPRRRPAANATSMSRRAPPSRRPRLSSGARREQPWPTAAGMLLENSV